MTEDLPGPPSPSPPVVAVGTSAGGIAVLRDVLRGLPPDLGAAMVVVMHIPPARRSHLVAILARVALLPVSEAVDGELFRAGEVYVAPPDRHLLVGRRRLHLSPGPREKMARPAIDPLFRSVARHHGPRSVGVVMSGMLDDGSDGLVAIRDAGGITIVQDPADAAFGEMPRNAVERVGPDCVVPAAQLAECIVNAVHSASGRVRVAEPAVAQRPSAIRVSRSRTAVGTSRS
jgi:two-component system chemotaxis response regulator CheB